MCKSEENFFIWVPDQNSRSHCTSQGLNRDSLSLSSSVTFAKSVKLLKLHLSKKGIC